LCYCDILMTDPESQTPAAKGRAARIASPPRAQRLHLAADNEDVPADRRPAPRWGPPWARLAIAVLAALAIWAVVILGIRQALRLVR